MSRNRIITTFFVIAMLCLALVAYLLNDLKNNFVLLSEKPHRSYSPVTLHAVPSTLGINLHVPYQSLGEALDQATAEPQSGSGEQQTCKRILGAKACATLNWKYRIDRQGETAVSQHNGLVRLSVPLALRASVGVNGKSAKLLGFQNKQLNAKAILTADMKISMQSDWCPVLINKLSYRWINEPKLKIIGNIKLNLKKAVDKALTKKLRSLEQKLSEVIDCQKLQHKIRGQWRVHSVPLELPDGSTAFLSITPQSAHISDSRALDHALSISLELNAATEVLESPVSNDSLSLPAISEETMPAGAVEFSLLLKIPYSQLNTLLAEQLLNKGTKDKNHNFKLNSIDVYPSGQRLIFSIGFTASGLSGFFKSDGRLYVSAQPTADPVTNILKFEQLKLTRIVDSKSFNLLSAVLHEQILQAINEVATIDLSRQVRKLEQSVINSLSNPEKTGGITINSTDPEIRLVTINPEENSLALIVHLSTQLTGTVPTSAIVK